MGPGFESLRMYKKMVETDENPSLFVCRKALTTFGGTLNGVKAVKGIKALKAATVKDLRQISPPLPKLPWSHALHTLEETSKSGGFGEVKLLRYLGDAERGLAQ